MIERKLQFGKLSIKETDFENKQWQYAIIFVSDPNACQKVNPKT